MNKSLEELAVISYGKDYKNNPKGDPSVPIIGTGGVMGYTTIPLNSGEAVLTGRKGSINSPIYVKGDFWNVDTIFCVKAKKEVSTKWLYYNLRNTNLSKLNEATGVPSVNTASLYRLEFNYFDFDTQTKIAKILTTLDNVIEKTEAAIAKYEAIKQGMMHDLFTRGIGEDGKLRPRFEDAPELYKESELGWIPKEWEAIETQYLAKITTGGKDTQDRVVGGKYPFFVRSSKIERINTFSFDGEGVLTAGDGVGTGKVFHYIQGKFDYHQRVYLIHDFKSHIRGKYFFEYFQHKFLERVEQYSAKNTVDSVRLNMIAEMLIPLPKESEQDIVQQRLDSIQNKINLEKRALSKQTQLKQGLMQDLLTGKVPVKADPLPLLSDHG